MSAVISSLADLQQRYAEYISLGMRVLSYKPPCGCPEMKTPAPSARKSEAWDSLSFCVCCGALHFKVVFHNRVDVRPFKYEGGAA